MAETAIAIYQPVSSCRWSRPGLRLTGWPQQQHAESEWVCIRQGRRRDVRPNECATCAHWQAAFGLPAASVIVTAPSQTLTARMLRLGVRAAMMVLAGLFVAIGVTILMSPAAIPLITAMFLCAAVCVGWVVFDCLPADPLRKA